MPEARAEGKRTLRCCPAESFIFARIPGHRLHRWHGLQRGPCWLVSIRVIR